MSDPTPVAGAQVYADLIASGGKPHEATAPQRAAMKAWLEADFYSFAYLIGGVTSPPLPAKMNYGLHYPVCDYFKRWGTPGWRRLMLQQPRGSYKTSLITRAGSLWKALKDPNTTIAIANEKVDRVEKWLAAIQAIISSNTLLHSLWADCIPPGIRHGDTRSLPRSWKWSTKEMNLVRTVAGIPEPTFTAIGVGAATAGGHWDWIFIDDLISEEAANSQAVMETAKGWLDTAVYLGKSPDLLNMFICCTRWGYLDVYRHAQEKHGFTLYRRQALEDGKSSFPELWSTDFLLKEQERDVYNFSAQFQSDPRASKDMSFDPKWIRYGQIQEDEYEELNFVIDPDSFDPAITVVEGEESEQWVRLSQMPKVLLVDPAPHSDTERRQQPLARTAMSMRAIDWHGRRFLLDVWAGRDEPLDEVRRMIRMLQEWGTHRIAVEEVAFSRLYRPILQHIARTEFRDYLIEYIPLRPKARDKDTRIQAKTRPFQAGFEYVAHHCKALLLEEYVAYPSRSAPRDILDTLGYDEDPGVLVRPESPVEATEREIFEGRREAAMGRYGLYDSSWSTIQ